MAISYNGIVFGVLSWLQVVYMCGTKNCSFFFFKPKFIVLCDKKIRQILNEVL